MEEKEEVKLFSSINEYEIDKICAILTDNNIPFVRKDAGSGAYLNVYMGQSIQEKIIYVNKSDYEKAQELVFVVQSDNKDEDNPTEDEEEMEEIKKYNLVRRLFGIMWICIPCIVIVTAILAIMKDL